MWPGYGIHAVILSIGLVFVKDRFKERFFGRYSRGRSVWPVRCVILIGVCDKKRRKSARESCFFLFVLVLKSKMEY